MNLRKINWIIIQKLNKIFKTSIFDEIYWKYRNCRGDWGNSISYFDSLTHSHREAILEILGKRYRYFTLAEVGCNSGPNLEAIRRRFPITHLAGIDINKKAIKEGRIKNPDISLLVAKVDKLPWPDKSFDVVLADAVLMYIGPDKIDKAIKEMVRVARDMIIIVDFHKEGGSTRGQIELGHWVRDYSALFKEHGLKAELRKITKKEWKSRSWENLGHFITVNLNENEKRYL